MTAELGATTVIIELLYLIASVLFILSLKWMSSPTTARHGIWAGEIGMVLAIGGTLLYRGMSYHLIAIALVLGTIIGVPLGRVAMTAVPQRTALSHAFGALCVTLVGSAEFYLRSPAIPTFMMSVLSLEVILGGLTVTGSLMAAGKLQEILVPFFVIGRSKLWLILVAYAALVALWCFVGRWLGSRPLILRSVDRHTTDKWGHWAVPVVFVGLGIYVLCL